MKESLQMTISQNEPKDKVPTDKQYEYFTTQLRYLDDKIFRSFSLFIQLAIVIVGGRFYIEAHPELNNRALLIHLINWVFVGIGLGIIFLISNNLRSWQDYRKELTDRYINVPELGRSVWQASEWFGCVGIVASVAAFLSIYSPESLSRLWILALISASLFVAGLPFLLKIMFERSRTTEKKASLLTFKRLTFWIISIQFLAALLPLSTRLPFPTFWTDWVPQWKKVNVVFEQLKPDDTLSEQFLGNDKEGFNEILDIVDRNFVELPTRKAIRGITNRMDSETNPSGEKLFKVVYLWLDFGNNQYLPIATRRAFWEQVKAERSIVVLWWALGLFILSIILRYAEFFKLVKKR